MAGIRNDSIGCLISFGGEVVPRCSRQQKDWRKPCWVGWPCPVWRDAQGAGGGHRSCRRLIFQAVMLPSVDFQGFQSRCPQPRTTRQGKTRAYPLPFPRNRILNCRLLPPLSSTTWSNPDTFQVSREHTTLMLTRGGVRLKRPGMFAERAPLKQRSLPAQPGQCLCPSTLWVPCLGEVCSRNAWQPKRWE